MQLDGKTTKLNTLVLFASVTLLITSTPLSEVPAADATVSNLITIESFQKISDIDGGFTGLLKNGDRFGRSADNIGDLDGDGVTDVAIGAGSDNDGGNNRGAVWILFLNNDGTVKSHQKISDTQGNGFNGLLGDGGQFSISIEEIGDFNNDGAVDIIVGASFDDEGGTDTGAVWVLFLNADGTVKSYQKISKIQGGFPGIIDAGSHFGSSLTNLGDLDGDGTMDVLVGSNWDDLVGPSRGAVWILFLNDMVENICGKPIDDPSWNTVIDNRGNPSATLVGTAGPDLLIAGDGGDILKGKDGNDCLIGGISNDELLGQQGQDIIFGGLGDDIIKGGAEDDIINGGAGNDTIYGNAGHDTISGDDGDDTINGNTGNDTINGNTGNDTINGNADNDRIKGDDGDDTIFGDNGDDRIFGNYGSDTIYGGAGNDRISGNAGDDTINGDDGDDTIDGGPDFDECIDHSGANAPAVDCEINMVDT